MTTQYTKTNSKSQ